jgi:hypothetical protein
VYVGALTAETVPVLVKQSLDGTEQYWHHHQYEGWKGALALAVSGDALLMLQENAKVVVIEPETGEERTKWDLLPDGSDRSGYFESDAAVDLDANGATVAVADYGRDTVRWIDDDGATVAEASVDSPVAVAVGPAGGVYVASEGRVLEVARSGTTRRLVDGLSDPRRLTVDPAGGDLLVAEGPDDHRVKRFARSGDLKRTYGREGGRREGPYEPTDFRGLRDLTADSGGGFLVSEPETGPRRTAHVDRDGSVVNEWYGGQPYYTWASPDPEDPTRVWFNAGGDWLVLASIDLDAGTWSVEETHDLSTKAKGLLPSSGGPKFAWRVQYHDGDRYLVAERSPNVVRHTDGELQPVVASGRLKRDRASAIEDLVSIPEGATSYLWTDTDGDGAVRSEEIALSESRAAGGLSTGPPSDFSIPFTSGGTGGDRGVSLLRPTWEDGVPRYSDVGPTGDPVASTVAKPRGAGRVQGSATDSEGNYYRYYSVKGRRGDLHGGWPTKWGGHAVRLIKWDADGNEEWKVGRHAVHGGLGDNPHTTPPGWMHAPVGIVGEVRDTVVLCDRVETPGMVWTKDGLYAGSLLNTRVDDGLPARVYHWWRAPDGTPAITASDNTAEGAVAEHEDGALWFAPGRQGIPVYRVRGWTGWNRIERTVSIDESVPHAAAAGSGFDAAYFDAPSLDGSPATERTDARVWGGTRRRTEGHQAVVDGIKPVLDWTDGVDAVGKPTEFAVRWTGEIEAQLSEPFIFTTYQRGGVRLWIDGEQRVFGWNETVSKRETEPIPLTAGERVPVQLDFYSTRDPPAVSLNWESPTQDRERIPAAFLYPDFGGSVATQPDTRSATERIVAGTFDDAKVARDQQTNVLPGEVRGNRVRGFPRHGWSAEGSYLGYERLDFGDGVDTVRMRLNTNYHKPILDLRVGRADGDTIGTLTGPESTDGYETVAADIGGTSRVQDLYIVNTQPKGQTLFLDWFEFQ